MSYFRENKIIYLKKITSEGGPVSIIQDVDILEIDCIHNLGS